MERIINYRPFLQHILVLGIIYGILASGFRFFVKLKGLLDFSYLAIVTFGTYAGILINIHYGIGILGATILAFFLSMIFSFFILYLSGKLNHAYFTIGSLALYILASQMAYNMDGITGGALGLSSMTRNLIGNIYVNDPSHFFWFILIAALIVFFGIMLFKKSYFYTVLQGWGENEVVVKSFGVSINRYKFVMIVITTFLAVVGGNFLGFYLQFIDPATFWLSMMILLLVMVFVSYSMNDWGTLCISILVVLGYEYLRFFKVVAPSHVGYFREIVFGIIIILVSLRVFRKISFGRAH